MELYDKFHIKNIENEVRKYIANIEVKTMLDKDLDKAENVIGYIDGPPTLNGEPHAGHLRGRVIKDLWYRFKVMQKNRVIFRAGWDTQGLPVELQAEKELGLTGSKSENIRKVGIEKIIDTCKKLIHYYAESWMAVDNLLGMSFDYEKAYWTFKDHYIEREWQYLRKAWQNGILREWFRVVAYCPSCQTSLSNAEVKQGYETVEDPSLYYKVRLSDEDTYLIVWTTMPFTVVTDELVSVHPDARYVRIMTHNERWIVSENRLKDLMNEFHIEEYSVDGVILGKELEKRHYVHPLLHLIPELNYMAKSNSIHFVVAEPFVDIETGSGVVHISPANGENDFETAVRRNIPIFVPIDDGVYFTEKAGVFRGLFVRDADLKVIESLREVGSLIKLNKIKHQYPTCWRSHHKVVWLARREYFYMIDKLETKPIDAAQRVEYFFDPPKNRFLEIIKESVPWCISRERLWGTPLPIWLCTNCQHKEFLFSRNEILQKAINLPDGTNFELHRPEIDRIEIPCAKCGSNMRREPFVLDTWHNSGAAPYSSLTDTEYRNLIPALFLTEGIDQTRGWAYTLLIENIILNQTAVAPFKSFLFQGHVLDENGNKMSKSKGNVIDAKTLLSDSSVDLIRFYFMWKSSPIESLNFNPKEMAARPFQIMSTLYYLHIYFKQNSNYDKFDLERHNLKWVFENSLHGLADLWLLSKLQKLILSVTSSFESCRFHEGAKALEEFIINFISQTYVPITRNDIWDDSIDHLDRRLAKYSVLSHTLHQVDILMHPLAPFITEYLYQTCFKREESITLEQWPKYCESLVRDNIENSFDTVKEISSLANAARVKAQLKRRWPVKDILICCSDTSFLEVSGIGEILKNQLNTESYEIIKTKENADSTVQLLNLLENKLPIRVNGSLVIRNIASRERNRINLVKEAFEKTNKCDILKLLHTTGSYPLKYEGGETYLYAADVNFSYDAAEGYTMAKRDDLIVFLSKHRNERLSAKGLLRDIARNLQQLRKERGYNPTDILSEAYVALLEREEISVLGEMKAELIYLVRVKSIFLTKDAIDKVNYKSIEFDGRELLISVE